MDPDRRRFLKQVGCGAVAMAVGTNVARAEGAAKRPNVVLIMTDDQGYGDLGCHGNKHIRTPNLDALHARSVRLTDFHVSPVCTPTRGALMTGRCPNRIGIWHVVMGPSQLRKSETTMADVFSANGYRTAIFGKWHLGDCYPFRPQDRGFDEVLVHGGGVVGHTPDYWLNDYFDDTYLHNGKREKFEGYCTDVWFDNAMKFIEANRNGPFFAYISTNAPHQPFQAPPKYAGMYEGNRNVANAAFYGMITRIDENIARFVKKLDALGLADNTILIFMTDNGTAAGVRGKVGFNAGMRGRKGSAYEGGHRVPCWFRWPAGGLGGGRDVSRLTDHVDILPTLIDLCGMKLPGDRKIHFDGKSIAPLLRDSDADWPDRVMVAEKQNVVTRPIKWRTCAVMTDRWRLVNGKELYDIKADPGQKRNIAAGNRDVVKTLRAEYDKWWAGVSESHDKVAEIIIGSTRANPTRLTCYHWNNKSGNQGLMPWGQAYIVAGPLFNGTWDVRIDRAGKYTFTLRRWPVESHLRINDSSNAKPPEKPFRPIPGRVITTTKARIRIQDIDQTVGVPKNAESVTFNLTLKPGPCRLQTWFMDDEGNSRGAFYVHAEAREVDNDAGR